MIWVTSDLHFCHDKEFLYGPRGFKNVYDMNDTIIRNWNEVVSWDDEVYVLGDLMLNDNYSGLFCIKQLRGQMHVIIGNHDTDARLELYKNCYNIVSVDYGARLVHNGYHFFLSHFPCLCANMDTDKPLKRQTINLCGHSHTQDPFQDMSKGLIYHCELDAHNNYPITLDNIIQDILGRTI